MGMHIVHTHAEGVVSADVVAALHEASSKGAAVLVVPSFEAQIAAQKQLAGLSDPALFGISATTLSAWIKERWDVWGDGRHLVEKPVRTIAIEQVLLDAGQAEPLPGMLRLLSSLAEEALPWLPLMPNSKVDEFRAKQYGLTAAEASAIGLVGAYADMIHGLGYIEPAEASAEIVPAMERAGAQVPALVVSGISKLGRSQRELLAAAARVSDVWFIGTERNAEADRGLRSLEEELLALAGDNHVACEETESEAPESTARAEELSKLRRALFTEAETMHGTGAVFLAEPEGPLAEAEHLAATICRLADAGEKKIVVSTPDPERAWRELAPKLACRHIAVSARLERPLAKTEAGHAFISYAETVAELAEAPGLHDGPGDGSAGVDIRAHHLFEGIDQVRPQDQASGIDPGSIGLHIGGMPDGDLGFGLQQGRVFRDGEGAHLALLQFLHEDPQHVHPDHISLIDHDTKTPICFILQTVV